MIPSHDLSADRSVLDASTLEIGLSGYVVT